MDARHEDRVAHWYHTIERINFSRARYRSVRVDATCSCMTRIHGLFGALVITFSFVACGDDDDDDDGDGSSTGGSAGTRGGTGGSATGGKGGSSGSSGSSGLGGTSGKGGSGGKGGASGSSTGGSAGLAGESGEGGVGGEAGGMGGEGGDSTPDCDPTPPPAIFVGELTGAQEFPVNASLGTGSAVAELDALETTLTVSVYYSGLGSNAIAGHVHGPAAPGANGPILFDLMPATGAMSGQVLAKTFAVNPTQVGYLKGGQLYANVHSANFTDGEIRAQLLPAAALRTGTLSGDQEVPANSSAGTGRAWVALLPSGNRAIVSVNYSGLTGPANGGHIHGPASFGENADILLDLNPSAATSGSIVHALWPVAPAQSSDLLAEMTYANIHTAAHTAGEIRAQLLTPCD
jgi:hypothetical protein